MTKFSAPLHPVPHPDEFPDVRVSEKQRRLIKGFANSWAERMSVDQLMFFAAALEYAAKKKREGAR